MAAGYPVHLANTTAITLYSGLKYSDDDSDACWLAKLLRLGLPAEGYIYPKEERAVRDLLRRRLRLIQQRTANLVSIQNQLARSGGQSLSANALLSIGPSPEPVWVCVGDLEQEAGGEPLSLDRAPTHPRPTPRRIVRDRDALATEPPRGWTAPARR
ncbi:hypothetical protein [Candidatus Thiodictyon syntrophicum]|jgi:hypothetical protein|uniref:Uncharacterized protein n=1 Tax=Candidatus Thiodictyon syntrophicum TaxID=1166950 RepID=A0A2K8U8A9_9GAMM|nr:hypothetical protein THSYN_13195 [Candidatus Thiodictyon syntrophicum]